MSQSQPNAYNGEATQADRQAKFFALTTMR
jgi:hypothetical protein